MKYKFMRQPIDNGVFNIPYDSICIEYIIINTAPETNQDGSQNQSIIECIQWLEPITEASPTIKKRVSKETT